MSMKAPNQRIELIALADMEPETECQRPTDLGQVSDIAGDFDANRVGVITVSWRNGKYQVIDGAHRAKSMRDLGYTHAYCVVLDGLTCEQEANIFRRQNENRRPLSAWDLFKAGLKAKDERHLRINAIAKAHGFQIGTGARNFYRLSAISTLFRIVKLYGYDVLDTALRLIATTWAGIDKASQTESLLGMAEFASRYDAVDFPNRMRDKFAAVWYEYVDSMSTHASVKTGVARKKFCRVIVDHYNRGLGSRSKIRLVWED